MTAGRSRRLPASSMKKVLILTELGTSMRTRCGRGNRAQRRVLQASRRTADSRMRLARLGWRSRILRISMTRTYSALFWPAAAVRPSTSRCTGFPGRMERPAGSPAPALTEKGLVADHLLRVTPGIHQELLPKMHELRATVLGEHVFGARILSQETQTGRLDWRRSPITS